MAASDRSLVTRGVTMLGFVVRKGLVRVMSHTQINFLVVYPSNSSDGAGNSELSKMQGRPGGLTERQPEVVGGSQVAPKQSSYSILSFCTMLNYPAVHSGVEHWKNATVRGSGCGA